MDTPVRVGRLLRRAAGMNPVLVVSALLATLAVGMFVANFDHLRVPPVLLWLPLPASLGLTAGACWRTSRTPSLTRGAGRFWRWLGAAVAIIGVASIAHARDSIRSPQGLGDHIGPVTAGLYSAGVFVLIWALCRLPMGASSPTQRLTTWLDAGTVALASWVIIWSLATGPAIRAQQDGNKALLYGLVLMVLPLVAVFGIAKVAMSGYRSLDVGALRLLAVGVLTGSLGSVPSSWLASHQYLSVAQYVQPVVCLLLAAAAERQRAAARADRRPERRAGRSTDRRADRRADRRGAADRSPRRRRQFSVLPYVAVGATDSLLLTAYRSDIVLPIGVVGLTALVVLRQLATFRENGRLVARLDHGASHDALTQLANRTLLSDRLAQALARVEPDRPLSVILIDLDDFKLVNDTLGHGVGDALLVAVAGRLTGSVRPGDTVARLGGDEFAVVLDRADRGEVDAVADRMLAALSPPVWVGGHELLVRASLGVADGGRGDEASELLRRADVAMYAAKAQGGSRHVHYSTELNVGLADQPRVGAELRQAIDAGQLRLAYQPLVDLDDGRITGVEALVRWAHPSRGELGPAAFVPVAERTGLIVPLGRWVLREACRQAAQWSVQYGAAAPARLNVNVSAAQLREPGFPAEVAAALAESGLPPGRLTLEVTETMAATLAGAAAHLRALRELGVRIALDDFGTGQSPLSLLQTCPVDELKLDRTFTQAEPVAHRATVAAAVAQLGHAFGLDLVAEGVETDVQANQVRALGYRVAQGYYFARPVAADAIGDLVGPAALAL